MPFPEELVFTVDSKVQSDINHAKEQYLETVSQCVMLCQVGNKRPHLYDCLLWLCRPGTCRL